MKMHELQVHSYNNKYINLTKYKRMEQVIILAKKFLYLYQLKNYLKSLTFLINA